MIRILKAFAWLRWRMLLNTLERTGSRDVLERFSLAIEKLGPIMAAVLMIPSALVLAALGAAAGYALAAGDEGPFTVTAIRYLLFAIPLLAIVGPLFLPAADRTNPVRLLLLPIPRSTLYLTQTAQALGDVWNILAIPVVLGMALGLAAGLSAGGFVTAVLGGALLLAVFAGIAALTTSLMHLVARDRRRGELVALLFIIVIPVLSMLPGLFADGRRERGTPRRDPLPSWVRDGAIRASALYPTELYVRAVRRSAGERAAAAITPLAALAVTAGLIHLAGFVAFGRVLDSPGSSGTRRGTASREVWGRRIPGLSPGASAVAMAHLRLALRTPRGRSILLSPLAVLIVFGIMIYRGSGTMDFGAARMPGGLSLATFACLVCLMAVLPIAMNQFAVDRAGLTMSLLSPLTTAEYLKGKAVGNALVAAPPTLISYVGSLIFLPGSSPYFWIALLIALPAIYLAVAPVAAILSAVFPRAVDMNSIGRGSNAHGAAGLLGMLAFVAAGVPPLLLSLLAARVLEQPALAPLLVLGWVVAAALIAKLLFGVAVRIFDARRENIGLVV